MVESQASEEIIGWVGGPLITPGVLDGLLQGPGNAASPVHPAVPSILPGAVSQQLVKRQPGGKAKKHIHTAHRRPWGQGRVSSWDEREGLGLHASRAGGHQHLSLCLGWDRSGFSQLA
jgi:hypothetical protein